MGVTLHKSGKWQVQVTIDNKSKYIGLYETLEKAKEIDDKYEKFNITKQSKNYVEEKDLRYEILVSLNQGFLTEKMTEYIILITKNIHRKFRYKSMDDKYDCYSYSLENLLTNWYHYDPDKYELVLPYMSELAKRGFAMQWMKINKHNKRIHHKII